MQAILRLTAQFDVDIAREGRARIWYACDLLAQHPCSPWQSIQMKPGVFREEYIAIIVKELLRGLEYLHVEGKLHRDIKGLSLHHN